MTRYVYPAIITPEDNNMYSVIFPNLEGCYTSGEGLSDALYMAEDVLAFTLYSMEKRSEPIPTPSTTLDTSNYPDGSFINFIACDTLEYQKMNNNKAVKKTLSIPEWLNEKATEAGINFSQTLQEALKTKLGIF